MRPTEVVDRGPGVPVMAGTRDAASEVHGTAVHFSDARRPEAATQVQMAEFDGPLALLLSLIEARQLDVLSVPLGALAGAYLDALSTLTADRLGNISAFVAVASQLILIKSRAMLPRVVATDPSGDPLDDGPDPEAELRRRLLLYRAFRDAGTTLLEGARIRLGLFRREAGAARAAAIAGARPVDAPPIDPLRLVRALGRLVAIAPPIDEPPGVVARTITMTERATIIREALRTAPTVVLQDLLEGVRDRVVIAITFLAMLELMKRREIVVEQAEPWGPIVARATTVQERLAGGSPLDAGQDAALDESLASFA